MAVDKKNRIKKVVLTWLCLAALVSGAVPDSFSGYVPTLTMTAAAEDPRTYVSEIDLQQMVNYYNKSTATPTGVRISSGYEGYTLYIGQNGTYKLKGSNYINNSYVDVTIRCDENVDATIFCDDVYIKNDYGYCGVFVTSGGSAPDPVKEHSSYYTPFKALYSSSTMTIQGNVAVETYYCQDDNFFAPLTDGNVNGSFFTVTYQDANGNTLGRTHYLSGGTYSDKSGITDGKCTYTMDGEGNKTAFSPTTITAAATVICADHDLDESGKCTNCGVQFRKVTVNDGINTSSTHRVADNDTFDRPADPTAPLGKKFAGWYVGDTKYDFSKPVTSDITVTAHYEDSLIKSVALAPTSNVDVEYIEGNTFDPTGLVITVTYDDARTEDITYDASNTKFSFSLLLTTELATTDNKVTVSYGTAMDGGSNYVDIPITVAAKQLTGIEIKTAPTKTAYIEGNKFDPTGLVITANYDNGKSEDIAYSENSGITFAPTAELTTADNKVTFTYGGKTAEQTITVANKQVTNIAIKTAPTKTAYIEGEKFNPAGLVITASYDNGKSEDIAYSETSGITFTPTGELTTADTKVTFTYGGKTAEQEITVANKQLTAIAIKTAPTKTAYIEGNKFDPTGLVITASYDNGKSEDIAYSETSGITFAPTAELTTADNKVTFTYGGKTAEQAITVSKKSSGGSSRPSRPTTPTTTTPSIGGSAKSWSDVAADLGKLTNGSEATIELNGSTSVSVDVIKAIADKDSKVTFVINSVFSWVVDGAEITAPAAADLTFIKTAGTKSSGLRGTEGTQFKINDTGVPTSLEIAFKKAHAGKFANLYKVVDGKQVFVTCAKLGEDGKVILPDVVDKGEYVVMLCEFSDRLGDMDNDGVMNAKDAAAILKDIVEIEPGKNPLMADFNGDGRINAMDAAAILKRNIGLA